MSILDDFISSLGAVPESDLEKVLSLILAKARRHTAAEAGSIFIVRPVDGEPKELRSCSLQNDRISVANEVFSIPINKLSLAGYVAETGEIVEVEDLYDLPHEVSFKFNRAFDDREGYRSQSMLAFPLKNFNGKVIGVVQLLNHIDHLDGQGNPLYAPFSMEHVDDMKSVMTVLGVMVERVALMRKIERLQTELDAYKEGTSETEEASA